MKNEWINARLKLPEVGERVLCCDVNPSNDKIPMDVIFTGYLSEADEERQARYVFYVGETPYSFFDPLSEKCWTVSHWTPLLDIPVKEDIDVNRFEIMDVEE